MKNRQSKIKPIKIVKKSGTMIYLGQKDILKILGHKK